MSPIAAAGSPSSKRAVEARIIALAKAIKVLATPQGESKVKTPPELTEAKVTKNFKEIIELAKKSTSLDGSVLNEVLMCCNSLRINNAALAAKISFLAQTAKKLVEERTMVDDDADTPTDTRGSSEKANKLRDALRVPHATPATLVSQVPKEKTRTETKLNELIQDGLPPLKNFAKPEYADGSQHSADFGFFDMSVHDRTGMPEWTGVTPTSEETTKPVKLQYSASQLNVSNVQ